MRRILVILLCVAATSVSAQEDFEAIKARMQSNFNNIKTQAHNDFDAFRRKANEDYARFLEQAWRQMDAMSPIPAPRQPKPTSIPPHTATTPSSTPLDMEGIDPAAIAQEIDDVPEIQIPAEMETMGEEVEFYSSKVVMKVAKKVSSIVLGNTTEKVVASAWRQLAAGGYDPLLKDCLSQRSKMQLCDWAYIQLCGAAAKTTMDNRPNESVLLQAFLLTQSGYRVRLAEGNGRLVLLVPFDHTVYNYAFLNIDGQKYYVLDAGRKGTYRVCQASFPRERTASIAIARQPQLAMRATAARTYGGDGRYPEMKVTLGSNRNLIDFYSAYPVSDAWSSYARASLSESTKTQLYPALRALIAGKSKQKATDMLLDFVQHAFDYKTDQDQFGYERPLFGDESFYYPYNDCEDRSILFAILVRELVGLDVVLLHYPGHLATAVGLGESAKGDYVTVNGRRFTVCDPTYIGATIGESMPQFKNGKVKIIML